MSQKNFQLSYAVIGKAMETHRELGPGLDERFYHELFSAKLESAGIAHHSKPRSQLMHRGLVADEFEADLLLDGELALELKVLWGDFVPEHVMQLICYLKFWRVNAGLLFDFGKESLVHRRYVFTEPVVAFDPTALVAAAPDFVEDTSLLRDVAASIDCVVREHGLGYRDTTYRGLLFADLKAAGIPCVRDPVARVHSAQGPLGEARLPCLMIPGRAAILATALRDSRHAADRALLQTCLRHLEVPWGVVVNFGRRSLDCQFASRPKPA